MTELLQIMGAYERASKEDLEKVFTKVSRSNLMTAGSGEKLLCGIRLQVVYNGGSLLLSLS